MANMTNVHGSRELLNRDQRGQSLLSGLEHLPDTVTLSFRCYSSLFLCAWRKAIPNEQNLLKIYVAQDFWFYIVRSSEILI